MASTHAPEPRNFAPHEPVNLAPPKYDPLGLDYFSKCDGKTSGYPTYVAVKGTVYDVTGKEAYGPGGPYHALAGRDASRALAKSSLQAGDIGGPWGDLDAKERSVLEDWVVFFSKRYNVVGTIPSS
ncbi:MAG: hypothetical protein M1829_005825 [Trizodia sp. TS-e1964]|nr:MAG: hypothetical protein M1829_005825 [Trizodia sp. TS-e1964]